MRQVQERVVRQSRSAGHAALMSRGNSGWIPRGYTVAKPQQSRRATRDAGRPGKDGRPIVPGMDRLALIPCCNHERNTSRRQRFRHRKRSPVSQLDVKDGTIDDLLFNESETGHRACNRSDHDKSGLGQQFFNHQCHHGLVFGDEDTASTRPRICLHPEDPPPCRPTRHVCSATRCTVLNTLGAATRPSSPS
jgi:hypothetical protein